MANKGSNRKEEEFSKLQKELIELKNQNEELKKKVTLRGGMVSGSPRWRKNLVVILLVLGLILAPFSLSSVWLNRQIVNTDAYVATVAPLSSNPVLQVAVANFVTNEIFKKVNVDKVTKEALPPKAKILVGPISANLKSFTRTSILRVVKSEKFSKIWIEANRIAHKSVTAILLGRGGVATTTTSGKITINLGPLLTSIKSELNKSGITILNNISLSGIKTKFTIFQSETLGNIKSLINFINSIAILLPLLVIAFIGSAIAISTNRRKTVLWAGIGLVIGMVVLAIGIIIIRAQYLSSIEGVMPSNVAAAVFDTIVQSLRAYLRGVFLLGLIVAFGAMLTGPSQFAVRLRSWFKGVLQRGGEELNFGPTGEWISHHKTILRNIGVLLAIVFLILSNQMTVTSVLIITLILIVYLAAIEFFGREIPEKTRAL